MRWDRNSVQEGMLVTSTTGQRIGKVIRCDADTFVVEKGALFPKDYQLRYDRITGTSSDGSLLYTLMEDEQRTEERAAATAPAAAAAAAAPKRTAASAEAAAQDQELRIPLLREELDIEKFAYESGRVKVHKGVRTEERHFTVPLRREEVVIEHIAATDWAPGATLDAARRSSAFEDQDLDIPIYEEDIRVGKHPVVREEFVVRTIAHAVDVEGSASLRSEDCDIEDTRGRPGASASSGDSVPSGYGAPGRR
jgi:uncharacterized protein (TIGR02271 family)